MELLLLLILFFLFEKLLIVFSIPFYSLYEFHTTTPAGERNHVYLFFGFVLTLAIALLAFTDLPYYYIEEDHSIPFGFGFVSYWGTAIVIANVMAFLFTFTVGIILKNLITIIRNKTDLSDLFAKFVVEILVLGVAYVLIFYMLSMFNRVITEN